MPRCPRHLKPGFAPTNAPVASRQMKIKFSLAAADGAPVSQEIYNTLYQLGPEKKLAAK